MRLYVLFWFYRTQRGEQFSWGHTASPRHMSQTKICLLDPKFMLLTITYPILPFHLSTSYSFIKVTQYLMLNWNGIRITFLFLFFWIFAFAFLSFFLFVFTLQYCIGFAIHQHESAMGIHMFPILKSPPTSLPVPSLWVIPVHQPQASCIMHQTWTGNSFHTWYYTYFIPPSPSPTESKRLFYTSVSLLLSRILGYYYHLSKFYIYALVYCIGVFLSGLLHSV